MNEFASNLLSFDFNLNKEKILLGAWYFSDEYINKNEDNPVLLPLLNNKNMWQIFIRDDGFNEVSIRPYLLLEEYFYLPLMLFNAYSGLYEEAYIPTNESDVSVSEDQFNLMNNEERVGIAQNNNDYQSLYENPDEFLAALERQLAQPDEVSGNGSNGKQDSENSNLIEGLYVDKVDSDFVRNGQGQLNFDQIFEDLETLEKTKKEGFIELINRTPWEINTVLEQIKSDFVKILLLRSILNTDLVKNLSMETYFKTNAEYLPLGVSIKRLIWLEKVNQGSGVYKQEAGRLLANLGQSSWNSFTIKGLTLGQIVESYIFLEDMIKIHFNQIFGASFAKLENNKRNYIIAVWLLLEEDEGNTFVLQVAKYLKQVDSLKKEWNTNRTQKSLNLYIAFLTKLNQILLPESLKKNKEYTSYLCVLLALWHDIDSCLKSFDCIMMLTKKANTYKDLGYYQSVLAQSLFASLKKQMI